MLLNAEGRPYRRVIGFVCEYRLADPPARCSPDDAVAHRHIDIEQESNGDENADLPETDL